MSIRIAVLGAGLIGRRHIDLVRSHPSAELAAVIDSAPGPDTSALRQDVAFFSDLDDFLASVDADPQTTSLRSTLGVIVATPNADHVVSARKCIEAGLAVLVEKPIADTVEGGLRLVEAAASLNARVLIGHHRRHSPLLVKAGQVVRDGVLGDLVAIQGSAVFYKPDEYFETAGWRKVAGGGPILLNMVHEIDNLRFLCGDVAGVQAFASSSRRSFEVEDTVAINLMFATGAVGSFLLSDSAVSARSWELTSQEDPAYPSHPNENCYEVAGTRGSLSVPTLTLRTYGGRSSWWEPLHTRQLEVARVDPLLAQLDHFLEVISGRSAPAVTPADALKTLATTLAIAKSARTGRVVRPEDLLPRHESDDGPSL
jgi:predicted dehydrogenase